MRYFLWLLPLIIILVIICIVIWPKEETSEETEQKQETISLSFDDQVVENVNFHNINISENDEYYIFTASITNLTADPLTINNVQIEVINSKEDVITTLTGYFGNVINGDETKPIIIKTKEDLSDAVSVNFTLSA